MRKVIGLGLALVTGLVSTAALAQEAAPTVEVGSEKGQAGVGADLAFFLPISELGDLTGPLIGALVKVEYPLTPALELTGRVGYLHGLTKENGLAKSSWSDIPIWVGARYFFGGHREGAYVAGETGLNYLTFKMESPAQNLGFITIPAMDVSDSEMKLGLNAAIGYKVNDLDFRFQAAILSIGDFSDMMTLGLTVGYTFAKF